MQIRDLGLFVSTVAVLLENMSLKRWFMYKSCVKSQAAQTAVPEPHHVCIKTLGSDFWLPLGTLISVGLCRLGQQLNQCQLQAGKYAMINSFSLSKDFR